jgi:hypothetical protein
MQAVEFQDVTKISVDGLRDAHPVDNGALAAKRSTHLEDKGRGEEEAAATGDTGPLWQAHRKDILIILSTSICSLFVALDATILITVLPVSDASVQNWTILTRPDSCTRIRHFQCLLGGDVLSACVRGTATVPRRSFRDLWQKRAVCHIDCLLPGGLNCLWSRP